MAWNVHNNASISPLVCIFCFQSLASHLVLSESSGELVWVVDSGYECERVMHVASLSEVGDLV